MKVFIKASNSEMRHIKGKVGRLRVSRCGQVAKVKVVNGREVQHDWTLAQPSTLTHQDFKLYHAT